MKKSSTPQGVGSRPDQRQKLAVKIKKHPKLKTESKISANSEMCPYEKIR